MTGKEIKNYLEMSYGLWTNTMVSKDDHIMLLNIDSVNGIKNIHLKILPSILTVQQELTMK